MSCTEHITQKLRKRGFRMTPQRLAVLQILHAGGHLTPSEIYERSRPLLPGMTEATVYRTLEFLAQNDVLLVANQANGHLAYELTGDTHHHILCRACGAQVEIEHALVQDLYEQLENASGFQLSTGHITFLGLCPLCKQRSGSV